MKNKTVTFTYTFADGRVLQLKSSPEVAATLKETQLKEQALKKQDRRYLDHYGYTEGETEHYISRRQEGIDDIVERMDEYERLHQAIMRLPKTQRRRIQAYYFEEQTLEEIADAEGVCLQSIYEAIQAGIKKLKYLYF